MKSKVDPDKYREELQEAKRLYVLKKKRSPYTVEFIEDPEDDWFVYVVQVRNTTKKFDSFSMIIQKDIDAWLNHRVSEGWEIVTAG